MPKDFAAGFEIEPHSHERAQLIYATAGTMRVATSDDMWVVPPQRALWMPAGIGHSIVMVGDVTMRTLYLRGDAIAFMPDACRVLSMSPLLRELIVRATELPVRYDEKGPAGHVVALILAELRGLQSLPLQLPMPRDPRLRASARRCSTCRATSGRSRRGRTPSTPAPAPSPAASRARPASASARGASRRACSKPWDGWAAARR